MDKQKVFIIDDSEVARTMLKNILKGDSMIEVVGEEKSGIGAIIMLEELRPDVVLLESNIAGNMELADVIAEMRKVDEGIRIVLCTDVFSSDKAMAASEFGADDLIGKPYRKQTLLRILKGYREGTKH